MNFHTYPGTATRTLHDRVPVWDFAPGPNSYSRFVTHDTHAPPLTVEGWLQPYRWADRHTPDNPRFDGIHVHVGHLGNSRNIVASLVRRDGGHKIATELGWRGYHSHVSARGGPELVIGRTYLYRLHWAHDRIVTTVWNEVGTWTQDGPIQPAWAMPGGHVGLRLDNLHVRGELTIRER